MLTKIITNNKESSVRMIVITLIDLNYFYNEISNTGTKIYSLNINKGVLGPLRIFKLFKIMIKESPDVIQTWMYHCDLIGVLLKIMFPKVKLVWNIRHSQFVKGADKKTTILIANLLCKLSFVPNKIICGSFAAEEYHIRLGYKPKKIMVIPNGFDTQIFAPNNEIKKEVKKELSIPGNHLIIGHIGREKKIKNQIDLLKAFYEISKTHNNVTLVLLGKGIIEKYTNHNLTINNPNIRLLGETPYVDRYLKSFDLFVLPSLSEGFPNVIGEAMSTGVTCISTEVGDSAKIIGNPKFIVKKSSPKDLLEKINYWLELKEESKREISKNSRERILELYSVDKIVNTYINLYKNVA